MKIVTIVGARPEFIQVAPVTRAVRERHQEILVHTGQHYDDEMSRVFFEELKLPQPTVHLGVGGGSHGHQTGRMLASIEDVLIAEKPDWVVVFGDTNSTLAGALAAAKLNVPLAHIEAGLRSFDRQMPEEVNRVLTDHVSTLLFAPTALAVRNLSLEGIVEGVHMVGDVRVDVVAATVPLARSKLPSLRDEARLSPGERFAVATIHRASNTDHEARLGLVLQALGRAGMPVVLPVHPRLALRMKEFGQSFPANIRPLRPISFLETVAMLDACSLVITDSGGLQKEAYMLSRPAITLRDTTEWSETIDVGWNRLSEPDAESFDRALASAQQVPTSHPELYGEPGVAGRIVDALERSSDRKA